MKGLLLRLSGLDADAENAVRVIGFFDRLITARADLDALVCSTAELAGCPVGVHAPGQGLSLRAEPGGPAVAPGSPPPGAATRELEGGVLVWVARTGAPIPLDDMLLERFAIATAILLAHNRVPRPELGDPALVELVLSADVGTAERARALHLLGFGPAARVRVLAGTGVDALAGRSARLGAVRAVLTTGEVPAELPDGGRAGVGPELPAIDAARSWTAARTALRFTSATEPVVWWERLGSLAELAGKLGAADLAELTDVRALDRLAAEPHGEDALATLTALCATGSARKAAVAVHRHHSTMPARLARAEAVLGFDVDTPAGRFRLHLALMLRRLRDNSVS
ncbi:helix-turn-helix domain-containing protein [Amycolatopsis sp. OK19-0408]|uniref:Helix-turn-helix domain-containing protein n=1 Tax=Amycolatopsis iheyensis TaxID=2945988 RepID=A0A9X2NAJ7_9PSEU|nr:helix-turn-helix domain-containing protein [Amycolatopsis iheyensis]MCR6483973.1 helix-turn-helix domain-containing protein [Amycolatopsis iheyensis]